MTSHAFRNNFKMIFKLFPNLINLPEVLSAETLNRELFVVFAHEDTTVMGEFV